MRTLIGIVCLGIVASGCGGGEEVTSALTTSQESAGHAVASESELPTCADDTRGLLYFIDDTDSFQVCKSSGWVTIDLTGPAGPTGVSGSSDGMSLTSTLYCGLSAGGYYFEYNFAQFSDGSAFVSCSVSNISSQASMSYIFPDGSIGATDGSCLVTFDSESPSSYGTWAFTKSGASASSTYDDDGSTIDGMVVDMTTGCTAS